jgi:hypothetical protein
MPLSYPQNPMMVQVLRKSEYVGKSATNLLEGVFETSDCRFRRPSGASRHRITMCDDAFISNAWFQTLLTVEDSL